MPTNPAHVFWVFWYRGQSKKRSLENGYRLRKDFEDFFHLGINGTPTLSNSQTKQNMKTRNWLGVTALGFLLTLGLFQGSIAQHRHRHHKGDSGGGRYEWRKQHFSSKIYRITQADSTQKAKIEYFGYVWPRVSVIVWPVISEMVWPTVSGMVWPICFGNGLTHPWWLGFDANGHLFYGPKL